MVGYYLKTYSRLLDEKENNIYLGGFMKIAKNLDTKKFAQAVYDIAMMTETKEYFFVREIFSEELWESIDLSVRREIGKKFDQILQDENYRNIEKGDIVNGAHEYKKTR